MASNSKDVNMINLSDIQRVKNTLRIGDAVIVRVSSERGRRQEDEKCLVIQKNRYFFIVQRKGGMECFGYAELLADEGGVRIAC